MLLYASCLVGGLFAAVTPPNVRAVLLNVNPPETRGTMFAFYSQIDDVGGDLHSPHHRYEPPPHSLDHCFKGASHNQASDRQCLAVYTTTFT